MRHAYDVIVVGLGAMGSATLYQLAQRGVRALGIDRFAPPHTFGSSHGETRITRRAVGEGEIYLPLVQRTTEIFQTLAEKTGERLFQQTGGLIIGRRGLSTPFHGQNGDFIGYTAALAAGSGIPHALLEGSELAERYPALKLAEGMYAYHEPGAGLLLPERCIATQLAEALAGGAELRTAERVLSYAAEGSGVVVKTENGRYTAQRLILTAGGWMVDFLPAAQREAIGVYRQVMFWFDAPDLQQFAADHFPWILWLAEGERELLGVFPMVAGTAPGVKVLTEQYQTAAHPDALPMEVTQPEIEQMYAELLTPRLKGVSPRCLQAAACSYTVTADRHFLIDFHPELPQVVLASPCSGHGFKHSAAVGEILTQLALDGETTYEIGAFGLR